MPTAAAPPRSPGHRRSRWTTVLAAAALSVGGLAQGSAADASIGNLAAAKAADGAHVVAETPVDAQMVDLTISSPALHGNGMVRLILPHDWAAQPTMTWPTLYMIPGSHSAVDYQSWTAYTDIESFMSPKDVLVVMPTDGPAGYSSNEIFGGPDYGTFQGVEVPQIMLAAYRSSGRNVVAGLSSGGVGAFDLAAEHPNQYRAAASYSGPLDTQFPDIELIIQTDLISAGESPFSLWGDPLLNANVWAAHNPRVLASRLRGTALFVSAGNGLPGPLDDLTSFKNTVGGGLLEAPALSDDYSFLAAAWLAGDHVTTDFYGPGTHIWPYWQRELHRSWPFLANGLGVPAT